MEVLPERYNRPAKRLRDLRTSLGDGETRPPGAYRQVELYELIDVLYEHQGLEDVPVNTIAAKVSDYTGFSMSLLDYVEAIIDGKEVYQYIIEWTPDWILARKNTGSTKEKPENVIWSQDAAIIKGTSEKTISDKVSNKELKGGQYLGQWYIEPDMAFETWVTNLKDPTTLYRRLLFLEDVMDLYNGDDVKELYQTAEELEKQVGPKLRGRYAQRSMESHFSTFFNGMIPKTVEGMKRFLPDYISSVKEQKDKLYR